MITLRITSPVARKAQRCDWCYGPIQPGYDDRIYDWISCVECEALADVIWDWALRPDEGGRVARPPRRQAHPVTVQPPGSGRVPGGSGRPAAPGQPDAVVGQERPNQAAGGDSRGQVEGNATEVVLGRQNGGNGEDA